MKNIKKSIALGTAVGSFALLSSVGQRIRITIPMRSELTEVQRLNRDGVDDVIKHKYEKAESLFFKAYLYDPADPFTLNNLGYVSELQGDVDRAANYYALALQQGCEAVIDRSSEKTLRGKPMMDALGDIKNLPMKVNRMNIYAIQLLAQNRGFEAESLLIQAHGLDPNNPFTLNNLGNANQATGDLQEALKYYNAAAITHSLQPVVVSLQHSSRGKAISDVAAGSAEKLRIRMAAMTPGQIEAQMLSVRGVAALNRNDWQAARKDFEDAFSADPSSAFALNNLGYVAERDGELETAVAYYARARRASDASAQVGMTSQTVARGERLASVAQKSRLDVIAALQARIVTPPAAPENSQEPVELIRRDGSPEPSPSPTDQRPTQASPDRPPTN